MSSEHTLQVTINQLADGTLFDSISHRTKKEKILTYHEILGECVKQHQVDATLYVYHHFCHVYKPTITTFRVMEPLHYRSKASSVNNIKLPIEFERVKRHLPTTNPAGNNNNNHNPSHYIPLAVSYITKHPHLLGGNKLSVVVRAIQDNLAVNLETSIHLASYLKRKGYLTPRPAKQTTISKYFNTKSTAT